MLISASIYYKRAGLIIFVSPLFNMLPDKYDYIIFFFLLCLYSFLQIRIWGDITSQVSFSGSRMPQIQDNSRNMWVARFYPEEFLRILEAQGSGFGQEGRWSVMERH